MRELIKTVRHIQVKMLVISHKVNVALRLSVCPVIHIVKLLVFKADLYEMRNYLQGLMDFLWINNFLAKNCIMAFWYG